MDLTGMMPDGESEAGKGAQFMCKGTVASVIVNGEAEIAVLEDGFTLVSTLDATRVSWAEVVRLHCEDYVVHINTKTSQYDIFKLGQNTEPLYAHMLAAYGAKVRKALFVRGSVAVRAKGNAGAVQGVPIEVYGDCILSLPPDLSARRLPLCFVTGFIDESFSIKVSTLDGKETVYSRLGYDHDPVSGAVKDALMKLRQKTVDNITELAPQVTAEQAAGLARLLPDGLAAPIGTIRRISPQFADALEAKIAKSRAAETYDVLRGISGWDEVCIGFKKNDMSAFGAQPGAPGDGGGAEGAGSLMSALAKGLADGAEAGSLADGVAAGILPDGAVSEDGVEGTGQPPDPYMLWLIAPTRDKSACAVEFAGAADESAATFVYRFSGDWDAFRIKLGMALEAISFKREIIRLSDSELERSENADYRMANDRNEAVRFVRASFVGRAIHRSLDSWKAAVEDLLSD